MVSDGTNSATYSYLANSALVDHIVFAHNGAAVMTNQNTYDYVNRLTGNTSALNFNYQYNAASQRTRVTLIDGSYWLYGYDALGQLTSAKKYFWDGTPYAGQQFAYAFDTIGNRTGMQTGGDQTGANLRAAGYTNNLLNQIASRGVPGYADVMGLGLATNTVSVNGQAAYQKWEYFREQLAVNNTSAALWTNVTVTAPGQTTVAGSVFVAKNPETFGYDADGNMTNDGRWTYAWDGENRLVNMTSLTNTPAASQYKLDFTYDYMGRRVQKIVSTTTNSGTSYAAQSTNRFVYDGWNPVAILNPASALLASFVWGTDLSGNMQGAGGVGGLLTENIVSNAVHFVAYDGNGNVTALVNAATGAVSANYEYGPFGEVIRATGPMAKLNPFMFSTKFYDWESGLYYYGARYYNPSTGRWIGRDPAEEDEGGPNLYGFVGNDPVDQIDDLGLVIVGFYGADTWWNFPNAANKQMKEIADAVGAGDHIYRSLDIMDPYQYLLKYFLAEPGTGDCNLNPTEPIKIFGYSWGGISAVKLSRWLGRSSLRNHEIDVYVIDPVAKLRLPPTSVPSCVTKFSSRYETHGNTVYHGIHIHGIPLKGNPKLLPDQVDVNPGPKDNGINHVNIVRIYKAGLIKVLKD